MNLEEIERYSRQVLLPEWGAAGQERLAAAEVRVAGDGEAARAAVLYLAGAGVGRLWVDAFAEEARALNPLVPVSVPVPVPVLVPAAVTVGDATIEAAEDRFAVGAAVAVEAVKAILGVPCRARVGL